MSNNTAADLVRPVAEEVGKKFVAIIKSEFNYWCCFKSNVEDLKGASKSLEDGIKGLNERVDRETENGQLIEPLVETWLKKAKTFKENATKIQGEASGIEKGCATIGPQYYEVSRKAKKEFENIEKHFQEMKSLPNPISVSPPPPAQASIPKPKALEFTSRKEIEEGVMRALRDDKLNLVGICGMGGVGKTTLAEKIQHMMKEEGLFGETVKVVVTQNVDLRKIQGYIAEHLGLKDIKDVVSLEARAQKLRHRLSKKQTLIILDDIWEEVSLKKIGIPCENDSKNCKVVLTSRIRSALVGMEAKIFEMKILSQEEALQLFKDEAGTYEYDLDLVQIAGEIVKECQGLPVAIVNISRALKEKDKSDWEFTLSQLKIPNRDDVPDFIESMYKPIKLSYELLKGKVAKHLLLFCSQFPEDSSISLEDLSLYAIGLKMLERVDDLRSARNEVFAIIHTLRSCNMVLDGDRENTIKMHDIIRDVIRFIASKEGLVYDPHHHTNSCKWILEFPGINCDFLNHHRKIDFSETLLLIIDKELGSGYDLEPMNFSQLERDIVQDQSAEAGKTYNISFQKMTKLLVLSFKRMSFESLPQTLKLLEKLQALHLYGCTVENISIASELVSLEILSCVWCEHIEEVPRELKKLVNLKLLEFSYCKKLKRISPGIISKLENLEELKMLYSFNGWESTNKNAKTRRNATLAELESLQKLVCLEIQIEDISLLEEDIQLPIVKKYKLLFGREDKDKYELVTPRHSILGVLNINSLELKGLKAEKFDAADWILGLLKINERLYFEGKGSINFVHLSQVQNSVKSLEVKNCEMLGTLAYASIASVDTKGFEVFHKLETLKLYNLPKMNELCNGPISEGSNSFKNLKEMTLRRLPALTHLWSPDQHVVLNDFRQIYVEYCDQLQNLNSLERAKDAFLHLEQISIVRCPRMEAVFINEKQNEGSPMIFPKLMFLSLKYSPSLTSFAKGIESVEFPILEGFWIKGCEEFIGIVSLSHMESNKNEDMGSPLFNEKVKCGELKLIEITECNVIISLFSSSMAHNFVNLKRLKIDDCKQLEQLVIGVEVKKMDDDGNKKYDDEDGGKACSFIFPELEKLKLSNLSSLTAIGKGIESVEFPILEKLKIRTCPSLRSLDKVKLGGLKVLYIYECDSITSLSSSSMVQNFVNLKQLEINSCERLEQLVIDVENKIDKIEDEEDEGNKRYNEEDNEKTSYFTFPKLEIFYVRNLPSLKTICKGLESIEFPKLEEWIVRECSSLVSFNEVKLGGVLEIERCESIINLFSSSVAHDFVNLKDLKISNCERLEQLIIGVEKGTNKVETDKNKYKDEDNEKSNSFTFPRLENLELWDLKSVTTIGKGIESIEFPILEGLSINKCPSFCTFDKVKFSRLNSLSLEECDGIVNLFLSSMAKSLVNLKGLFISDCKHMKQLVTGDEKMTYEISTEDDESNKQNNEKPSFFTFPKLEILQLWGLSGLTTIGKDIEGIEFPMLQELDIRDCSNLRSAVSSSIDNNNTLEDCTTLLHSLDSYKVKFDAVKILTVKRDLGNIWCQHTSSLRFFQTVEALDISDCNSIKSLFSARIAINLVNLKRLVVENCERMEQLIAPDKEIREPFILFPSLEELELRELPLLEMLCEWTSALECPLLEKISIWFCPRMNFFTPEFLSTPKLSYINIGSCVLKKEAWKGTIDINSFLREVIAYTREQNLTSSAVMEYGEIEEES